MTDIPTVILTIIALVAILIVAFSAPGVVVRHRLDRTVRRFDQALIRFQATITPMLDSIERMAKSIEQLSQEIPVSFTDIYAAKEAGNRDK